MPEVSRWPWLLVAILLTLGTVVAYSQRVLDPIPVIAVCAYNASPVTVASGQFVLMQCDSVGRL